jgi:hypothetical protein
MAPQRWPRDFSATGGLRRAISDGRPTTGGTGSCPEGALVHRPWNELMIAPATGSGRGRPTSEASSARR